MDEQQAGNNSPSPQQQTDKMPWEAGFWGAVGDTIKEVTTGLRGAAKAPAKPSVKPWEDGFWGGAKIAKPKPTPSLTRPQNEAAMKKAAVIQPHEVMPDTQSVASNIAEIDAEIKRARSPEQVTILKAERAKLERMK